MWRKGDKMKILLAVILSLVIVGQAQAKEYKVTLDDKYVPYFEKQESVAEVGAVEWLRLQAMNAADKVINTDYHKTRKSNRDDKIDEIKK